MQVSIKSEKDLEMLRKSGKILAKVLGEIRRAVKSGVSTAHLNEIAGELISKENAVPAFKDYQGFPANICASVNEEVIHGIPGDRKLMEGDIVSLDVGINYEGYFSDAALTLPVGSINPRIKKLIEVTKKALFLGIKEARIQNHLSDISYSIQNYVEKNGFSVIREFVGHGIGFSLHEEPQIPNFGRPHQGPILRSGMVLAIEPMVNMGTWEVEISRNGWTAVSKDGLPSAHFEHTVAVTENGPEILTEYYG
ncbi:MAG: type I methionyl aminopeptidase [Candidatus Omnitrophota bacterium]|nr:type I methionyl aminopeptidase [Candidatus Omnitrophota bacterium]